MKRAITLVLAGLALIGCGGAEAVSGGIAADDTVAPLPEITTTVPAPATPPPTTTDAPTTTSSATSCEEGEGYPTDAGRMVCENGVWVHQVPATTTVPPTTVSGPNLVGATNFINNFVGTLTPDLVGGACEVLRTQPDTAMDVMRENLDFPAVHEQAATYGLSSNVFIDMMVLAYGNRLVTECS